MRRLFLVLVAAVLVLGSGALAVAQEGTPTTEGGGDETPCPAAMGTPGASPEATEAGAAMATTESSPAASPAEAECHVDIEDFAFGPAAIEIDAGTTVVWENYDSAAHTVTADDGSFDSGEVTQGQTFSQTFDTPGTFTYHCAIHPNMTGTITVR